MGMSVSPMVLERASGCGARHSAVGEGAGRVSSASSVAGRKRWVLWP